MLKCALCNHEYHLHQNAYPNRPEIQLDICHGFFKNEHGQLMGRCNCNYHFTNAEYSVFLMMEQKALPPFAYTDGYGCAGCGSKLFECRDCRRPFDLGQRAYSFEDHDKHWCIGCTAFCGLDTGLNCESSKVIPYMIHARV